jgi:hypothetical protein
MSEEWTLYVCPECGDYRDRNVQHRHKIDKAPWSRVVPRKAVQVVPKPEPQPFGRGRMGFVGLLLAVLFINSVIVIFTGHDTNGWQPWPGVALTTIFGTSLFIWFRRLKEGSKK